MEKGKIKEIIEVLEKCEDITQNHEVINPAEATEVDVEREKEFQDMLEQVFKSLLTISKPASRSKYERQKKIAKIENYLTPNTKVSNDLASNLTFDDIGTEIPLLVNNSKQKDMKVFYSVNFDDVEDKNVIYNRKRPFSEYDRAVYNTIVSIYEAGNQQFTLDQLTRIMYSVKNGTSASTKQKEEVASSLNKMIITRVLIDCSEQFGDYADLQPMYEGYLLNADKITVLADNGRPVVTYVLNQKPILYSYAQAINQVISVDMTLLDTKSITRNTDDIIAIKSYLIKRIETIKNGKSKLNNTILYDTIFKNCDIEIDTSKTRTQANRVKTNIKKLLDEWQSKKMFSYYEENKKGNKLISISIFP